MLSMNSIFPNQGEEKSPILSKSKDKLHVFAYVISQYVFHNDEVMSQYDLDCDSVCKQL